VFPLNELENVGNNEQVPTLSYRCCFYYTLSSFNVKTFSQKKEKRYHPPYVQIKGGYFI